MGAAGTAASLARAKVVEAKRLVRLRPALVSAVASEALVLARAAREPGLQVEARLTRAVAALSQNRVVDAERDLAAAERLAHRHALDHLLFQVLVTWIPVLAEQGRFRRAHGLILAAFPSAEASERAALRFNQGYLLQGEGRLTEALAVYEDAIGALQQVGDRVRQARLLNNRAVIHTQRGRLEDALADLHAAELLYASLGEERLAVDVRANIGWTLAYRGDLGESLRWFDRVDASLRDRGEEDNPLALRDRVDALLAARLLPEARSAAQRAEKEFVRRGVHQRAAELRLILSQILLLEGDHDSAERYASSAARTFRRQGLTALAARSVLAAVHARAASGRPTASLLRRVRGAAAELSGSGWVLPALDARLIAAQLAVGLGRSDLARSELAAVPRLSGRLPALVRARIHHARAVLAMADGDPGRAQHLLRRALAVLDLHRSSLGATELRTLASMHAQDVATLGIDLALQTGNARQVAGWVERSRANALWLRPAPFVQDPGTRAVLGELRQVVAAVDDAVVAGRDPKPLLARQAALEQEVRRLSLTAAGDGDAAARRAPITTRRLAEALRDRILLEIVQHRGRLIGISLDGSRGRAARWVLHDLGEAAPVTADAAGIRFTMRRLSRGHGSASSLAAGRALLSGAAARIAAAVLDPVVGEDRRPLVLVPTGALHGIPWHLLPGCRDRPVVVAPSADLWLRAELARAAQGERASGGTFPPVLLAAGPGLPGAEAEVGSLAQLYPGATVLQGTSASVAQVLAGVEKATLAHLSAHGVVRADNPHFSSLRLADGPLTVYDLEGLGRVPDCLVLSACDAGLSDVRPGDELRGFVSALLSLGASTVVASVVPVADLAAHPLMVDFHRALAAGESPATALAQARAGRSTDGEGGVAAGFVCFGAG